MVNLVNERWMKWSFCYSKPYTSLYCLTGNDSVATDRKRYGRSNERGMYLTFTRARKIPFTVVSTKIVPRKHVWQGRLALWVVSVKHCLNEVHSVSAMRKEKSWSRWALNLSPWYGHVILVNGYLVLPGTNWPLHGCPSITLRHLELQSNNREPLVLITPLDIVAYALCFCRVTFLETAVYIPAFLCFQIRKWKKAFAFLIVTIKKNLWVGHK